MKQAVFFCLLCFLIVSCSLYDNTDNYNILDSTVKSSYVNLKESNVSTKSILLFDNGQSASDCISYLKLTENAKILETVGNQLVKSEYLLCDTLSAISRFELYPEKTQHKLGEMLLNNLDLRTFPNSLSRLTDDNTFTLKKLFPEQSGASVNAASYESEDWVLTLKVVAILNANNNDIEDWLLQIADESKTGNYRNYATFLVYDIETDKILKAVPFP